MKDLVHYARDNTDNCCLYDTENHIWVDSGKHARDPRTPVAPKIRRPAGRPYFIAVNAQSKTGRIVGKIRKFGRLREKFGIEYAVPFKKDDKSATLTELTSGMTIGKEEFLTEEMANTIKDRLSKLKPDQLVANMRELETDPDDHRFLRYKKEVSE